MSTKKFIFIPVVNNFELLQRAINSVPENIFDKYFIINNSNNKKINEIIDLKHFTVYNTSKALTFRETQNLMRNYAILNNYDYYSFMHNDGEILDDCCIRLIKYADEKIFQNKKFGAIFTHYDVFCVYSTECVKNIGLWGDNLWPPQKSGYLLDVDYYKRMTLSGYPTESLPNVNVSHFLSNTIKNAEEKIILDTQMPLVEKHYSIKWGGPLEKETRNPIGDTQYNHHTIVIFCNTLYKYGVLNIKTVDVTFTQTGIVVLSNNLCGSDPLYGTLKYLYNANNEFICTENDVVYIEEPI